MGMRAVLAGDHAIARAGIRTIIANCIGLEIAGEAGNGQDAIEMARTLQPDLVIIDLGTSGVGTVEIIRQILANASNTQVIILSAHTQPAAVADVLKAGATGYLLKNCAADELRFAISAAIDRRLYLSPIVADVIVRHYVRGAASSHLQSPLTRREREVLQHLAEGKTSKEIAAVLIVAVKTVETHRQQIMDKLRLHSVAELTKYAIREGLTSLET